MLLQVLSFSIPAEPHATYPPPKPLQTRSRHAGPFPRPHVPQRALNNTYLQK
ncbi:hypothetical protein L208DRAFT_1409087 [Tricholoma matsutake]|nr:hypothetical protein L208DRAFT_1409087 [Tricholoma matsutake 945]